tara:strand:- start:11 stop:946 length:936 start_codon:yes stop_codon:yes gene_type:complete
MKQDFLVSCVEQGLSIYQIKKLTNKAHSTVRYWLNKYNLKTKHKSFKNGYEYSIRVIKNNQYCSVCNCHLNNETGYFRQNKGYYSPVCKNCITEKRRSDKFKAVNYKGGSCIKCGYNKNITVLEFHHLNPEEKEVTPSQLNGKSWEKLKKEIDKCILLCSNCHREEHQRIDDRIELENNIKPFIISNFSDSILTGKNTGETSCYICDKVITEENLASKKHTPLCKSCNSKRAVNLAKNGKKRCVDYMGGCCSICEYEKCTRALEFHHTDPNKKSKDYNKKFKFWNFDKQKKELESCILVCSNCHREIHNKS